MTGDILSSSDWTEADGTRRTGTDAGAYSIRITASDNGNYAGSASSEWTILPKTLTDSMVSVSGPFICDGTEKTITIIVQDGTALTSADWTVSPDSVVSAVDAGTYPVKVVGRSNYAGTVQKLWNINVEKKACIEGGRVIGEFDFVDCGISKDADLKLIHTDTPSEEIREILGGKDVKYVYGVTVTLDGQEIQPDGAVIVRLLVPDGFRNGGFSIYHIHGGIAEKVEFTVEDGYAVFAVSSFSEFAFTEDAYGGFSAVSWTVLAICIFEALMIMTVSMMSARKSGKD